jgi:hypothetical protein
MHGLVCVLVIYILLITQSLYEFVKMNGDGTHRNRLVLQLANTACTLLTNWMVTFKCMVIVPMVECASTIYCHGVNWGNERNTHPTAPEQRHQQVIHYGKQS